MVFLYALFILSVICPIYTYALYPMILRIFKEKIYNREDITPKVSVIIVGDNADKKIKNVGLCLYPNYEIFSGGYDSVNKAKGEFLLFTDTKTKLDIKAIDNIVKPFSDDRIGAVVGQQTNSNGNSLFWKYENYVKKMESRIGCVSGANESLFAVRKRDMPKVPNEIMNKPFFIATKITEAGKDIVFEDTAKAYEGEIKGTNFNKHVEDAAGYWQAFRFFLKMLSMFQYGSFVYVSHRVMKWFVWLNMLMMLVIPGFMALLLNDNCMSCLFGIEVIGYVVIIIAGLINVNGPIGRLLGIAYYFVMLNLTYFIGLFRWRLGEDTIHN